LTRSAYPLYKKRIRVGAIGRHQQTAELVVKKINAAAGVLVKQEQLAVEGDVCKPEIATNTATKLVSEGLDVVLDHICSGATKPALGIYKDAKVIAMSPSATNPGLTQSGDYPNFYRTIASGNAQAKKIAVLHDKGDYGKGLAGFAKASIESDPRGDVVLYEGITPGAVAYSAVVQKVKPSGADAVVFGG
jgi:branched-chain amino acid transport system substrate-binding protein